MSIAHTFIDWFSLRLINIAQIFARLWKSCTKGKTSVFLLLTLFPHKTMVSERAAQRRYKKRRLGIEKDPSLNCFPSTFIFVFL